MGHKYSNILAFFSLIFTVIIGLYTLLFSEVVEYIGDESSFLSFPWNRYNFNASEEIKLSDLFVFKAPYLYDDDSVVKVGEIPRSSEESSDRLEKVFILVLDISESVSSAVDKPSWFDKMFDEFVKDGYIKAKDKDRYAKDNSTTILDIAKMQMYNILDDLLSEEGSLNSFSIWTVGNYGERIFPNIREPKLTALEGRISSPISKQFIIHAIDKIATEDIKASDPNTDFGDLFGKISQDYISQHGQNVNKKLLVITVLSDLLHDIKGKKGLNRKEEIRENWEELEMKIQQLSNFYISANMIVLTRDGELEETDFPKYMQLYSVFDTYLRWDQLEQQHVVEELRDSILFPTITSKNKIKFYYENERKIENDVFISIKQNSDIIIDVPKSINSKPQPDICFYVSTIGRSDATRLRRIVCNSGKLYQGTVLGKQRIRIMYKDKPILEPIKIRMIHSKKRIKSLIDVEFVKIPSFWRAIYMLILQGLFILSCFLLIVLLNRERGKNQTQGGSQDESRNGLVSDDESSDPQIYVPEAPHSSTEVSRIPHNLAILGWWSNHEEKLEFTESGYLVLRFDHF